MSEIDEKIEGLSAKMTDMQDYVEHLGDRIDFLIKLSRRSLTEQAPPPLRSNRVERMKALLDIE